MPASRHSKVGVEISRPSVTNIGIACLFSLSLLALSYARILGDAGSAAFGGAILGTVSEVPLWGTVLGTNLALFAFAQIAIHIAFGLVCLALAHFCHLAWQSPSCTQRSWLLLWLVAGTTWVLIANATLFPPSSLGSPYAGIARIRWHGISLLGGMSGVLAILIVVTAVKAITKVSFRPADYWPRSAAVASMGLAVIVIIADSPAGTLRQAAVEADIIFIGLDSLRADALGKGDTPAIDAFFSQAARFSDTTTPLARTFPAWVSLLSGKHPHTTGATVNLLPRHLIHTGETLPQTLRRSGYATVYAIDEVRFSNLDTSYGFDKMIAPPIGATDFLLGFFADTPLSNLLVNTYVGRKLFPYAHANRAAATTYDPDAFINRIEREIPTAGPVFLATHLTLAHWPYSWAGADWTSDPDNLSGTDALATVYRKSLRRLDRQFSDLLQILSDSGLTRNATIVVFSDHGESLGEHRNEHMHGAPGTMLSEGKYFGHGTSVFAQDQYRVVLGIRSFGNAPIIIPEHGIDISAPVSLEDIAPTIVEAFSLDSTESYEGLSLLPLLQNEQEAKGTFSNRIRFTETEFNPAGIAPGTVMTSSALKEAARFYQVDPLTDRISIKESYIGEISEQRQFAAFRGSYLLATLPPGKTRTAMELAFMSTLPGQASEIRILDRTSLEQLPDASALWNALSHRFPSLADRDLTNSSTQTAGVEQ